MNYFKSRAFVVITTMLTLALGIAMGFLLGYKSTVRSTGGSTGITYNTYSPDLKLALGYWALALMITILVFLICCLIRKVYLNDKTND